MKLFGINVKVKYVSNILVFLLVGIRYFMITKILGEKYEMWFDYQWSRYKIDYSKSYNSFSDEFNGYKAFLKNLKVIDRHNERYEAGLMSWSMGINQFSDMPNNQLPRCQDYYVPDEVINGNGSNKVQTNHKFIYKTPDSIDWRDFDAVMPVRNQLSCCSSYAMATVGAIESHNYIQFGLGYFLSPQEIIDCSVPYNTKRCNGGNVFNSFKYVIDKGLDRERWYPYEAKPGACRPTMPLVYVAGFAVVPSHHEYLLNALGTVGPVVAMISIDNIIRYKSGVFECSSEVKESSYAVLLVGYGMWKGIPYWLIKMSWGQKWGEDGYLKIKRDNTTSQCGLLTKMKPVYPIIKK